MQFCKISHILQKVFKWGGFSGTKDICIRLLRLKIMASAVAAIYINLPTTVTNTYRERTKLHFSCIISVNGNYVNSQYIFFSIFRKYCKSFSQICNENPATVSSENKLSRTHNWKVASLSLGEWWGGRGEWMFNTTTEVPLSKAPNLQLLLGRRTINGCPLLWVCVCVCSLLCVCSWCVCVFTAGCVHLDG